MRTNRALAGVCAAPISFTDDRGNSTMLGATAGVVSYELAPF
jgi:hypothetical protein